MKDERLFDCVAISGCTRGNACDLDGRCRYAPDPAPSQQLVADTVEARLKDMNDPQVWTATLTGPDGHSESICTEYPDVLLKWLIAHSERLQLAESMKTIPAGTFVKGTPGYEFHKPPYAWNCQHGAGRCPNALGCAAAGLCQSLPPDLG